MDLHVERPLMKDPRLAELCPWRLHVWAVAMRSESKDRDEKTTSAVLHRENMAIR